MAKTRRSGNANRKRQAAQRVAGAHGLSHRDLKAITADIEAGRKMMQPAVQHADKLLGHFAGAHHTGSSVHLNHLPILHRAMLSLLGTLAGQPGEWSVTPKWTSSFDPISWAMQSRMQVKAKDVKHLEQSQLAVLNALCGWGLTYTFLKPTDKIDQLETGEIIDPADFGFQSINIGDTFVGRSAIDPHHIPCMGHGYRAVRQEILDSGVLTEDEVALLPGWSDVPLRHPQQEPGQRQAHRYESDIERDYVYLVRVFLNDRRYSREPLSVVLVGDERSPGLIRKGHNGTCMPVSVREWSDDQPDNGGYNRLGFIDIPGSPLPSAPAAFMLPMAEALNRVLHQWIKSMDKHKKMLLARKGAVHDELVQAIARAKNDHIIEVSNPGAIQNVEVGGPSDMTSQGVGMLLNMSSKAGLNPEFLDATGEMTATEVQAIQEQLGVALGWMVQKAARWQDVHAQMFSWFEWNNPMLEHGAMMELTAPSGRTVKLPMTLTKEMLTDRNFFEHNFTIRHGSMARRSDSQIAQTTRQLLLEDFPMAVQLEQATQGRVSVDEFLQTSARALQIPRAEIERLTKDSRGMSQGLRISMQDYPQSLKMPNESNQMRIQGGLPGGENGIAQTGNQSAAFNPGQIAQRTMQGIAG